MGNELELINSSQVCELLNITHNNLHQMQNRGQLKWVEKKGKFVYYNADDVRAFAEKRANGK
jgi:predicted site-specific integrase-resolvase